MRFIPCMRKDVVVQAPFSNETLAADITNEIPFTSMNFPVGFQGMFGSEPVGKRGQKSNNLK